MFALIVFSIVVVGYWIFLKCGGGQHPDPDYDEEGRYIYRKDRIPYDGPFNGGKK